MTTILNPFLTTRTAKNDLTMDLDENPSTDEPVTPSPHVQKPGKLPDTIIPPRRPTQPTIVAGKPSSTELNDSVKLDFTLENELLLKRKPVERSRTNKHKKRK